VVVVAFVRNSASAVLAVHLSYADDRNADVAYDGTSIYWAYSDN
jgi:hypothetical protein